MKQHLRLRQAARYSAALLCFALLVIFSSIHIDQWLYRRRAEALLSDIRSLDLRQTTYEQTRTRLERWDQWTEHRQPCTSHRCSFHITLNNAVYRHLWLFQRHGWLGEAYMFMGGRPATIVAVVGVRDGIVWEKDFFVAIEVPGGRENQPWAHVDVYSLLGHARTVSQLPGLYRNPVRHPDYVVGKPSGCKICLAVWFDFTPWADREDIDRLFRFNLSCLGPWSNCRTESDIMPAAWEQFLADRPHWEAQLDQNPVCASEVIRLAGRDYDNAALVEVVSREKRPNGSYDVRLKLREPLKRARFWPSDAIGKVGLWHEAVALASGDIPIMAGGEFVVLFNGRLWDNEYLLVEHCGFVPATAENLRLVRGGIEQDYRAADED